MNSSPAKIGRQTAPVKPERIADGCRGIPLRSSTVTCMRSRCFQAVPTRPSPSRYSSWLGEAEEFCVGVALLVDGHSHDLLSFERPVRHPPYSQPNDVADDGQRHPCSLVDSSWRARGHRASLPMVVASVAVSRSCSASRSRAIGHRDQLADFPQDVETLGSRAQDLQRQEVHRSDQLAVNNDRKAERRADAVPSCDLSSGKGPLLTEVGDEDQVARLPGATGETRIALGKPCRDGHAAEFLGNRARLDGEMKNPLFLIECPECSVRPAERFAYRVRAPRAWPRRGSRHAPGTRPP